MSSRVLKKLQGADELQPNDEDVDNLLSSGGEEDPDLQSGKGKSNFFDLVRVIRYVDDSLFCCLFAVFLFASYLFGLQ